MTLSTGLDTAAAAPAGAAKAALDAVGGSWWLVYLPSGTRNGGSGWTPEVVRAYAQAGVKQFLPCWVGNQVLPAQGFNDPLTYAVGYTHAARTCADMRAFGFGPGSPVAQDTEYETATGNVRGALAYNCGWSDGVRAGGFLPGVYAPLRFLELLAWEKSAPAFCYAADWLRRGVDHTLSPAHIPGLPDAFWQGARAWQYAGGANTYVNGIAVDVDTADFPLANAPGLPYHTPPTEVFPVAGALAVTMAHFARVAPVLVAAHGPLLAQDVVLETTGQYTTHWAGVHLAEGHKGWAFRRHLRAA